MTKKLDDIFNECYERIRSGESLESCLMRYPEHAAELEPLLKTALDIGRRASYIHPRPEFKHWALVRLEGAQHHARQQRQPAKPGHFTWRQSWAVAIASVLVLLLAGVGTAAASSNALPDEPLYPVKLAAEQVRLTLAVTDAQKAQIHIQLVETRAVEVETMANEGKTEHAAITAARLAEQLELANAAIDKLETASGATPPSPATTEPTLTEPAPPEAVTEEQQPPTEEQTTPAETTTEEQPPAEVPPTPAETTTEEQPPTTEEQPSTTEEPQTTPADTKQDKWAAERERFNKSLEESTSKSLTALENAKEKASTQSKNDWQRVIDTISEKSKKKPTQTWPSQPTPQSDNKTGNGWKPNPVNPSQNQPSSSKWQKNR